MNELDLYYRVLREYNEAVAQNRSHTRFIQAAQKAPAKDDKLETIRTRCIIDEEWILKIEEYLPFVEKAIREDRQFIRQEGETVPIEKAKKVSKTSVSHLARHSDYITHLPDEEGEPLLPDKIYITENESNYAVYENRFLYMLLCYTRDFVELRYTKISELGNTYRGSLKINKRVEIGKRTVSLEASLQEVSKNDRLSEADQLMNDIIERLESIRVQVSALLMTPLMNEVSKAPMLRPPITRTNVLRMNNNFKNAVELYDYLSAYQGAGYTIKEIKKSFAPFPEKMGGEIFQAMPLLAFLVYKYGNDLEGTLKESYEKEETERALQKAQKKAAELAQLKKRIQNDEKSMEEYLLSLEGYVKDLEGSVDRIQAEQRKANADIERLTDEVNWQKGREKQLKSDLEAMAEKSRLHQEAADAQKAELQMQMETLAKEKDQILREEIAKWQDRVSEISVRHREEKNSQAAMLTELQQALSQKQEEQLIMNARLHAYQAKCGERSAVDLTDAENFAQLEREREWFEKMFKQTWSQTKKRIRKEHLWSKKALEIQKNESQPAPESKQTSQNGSEE